MNFPPVNHLTRGNVTLLDMEDGADPELWEPQTVIVVVIFGLVCVLHLMAFLYTVCLQSYVNAGAQTFTRPVHYRGQTKKGRCFMDSSLHYLWTTKTLNKKREPQ